MKICPKCASEEIIRRARVIDRGDYNIEGALTISVDENPEAFLFKQRIRSHIFAAVCGACGFAEFYAENPQMLYTAYQNQKNEKD